MQRKGGVEAFEVALHEDGAVLGLVSCREDDLALLGVQLLAELDVAEGPLQFEAVRLKDHCKESQRCGRV